MTGVDDATFDRVVGAVLGSATGDALGAGYEFLPQDPDQEIAMIGGGPFAHKWAKGEWTDDTQMAVAILDVIATGSTDLEEIGANFLAWHAANPYDMGNQTRSVLSTADYPEELTAIANAYVDANERSAGNGGLMRTAPVALAALDDRVEIAQLAGSIASLTHAHPDSVAACVLWSLAIQEAITTAEPDQVFDWEAATRNGLQHVAEDHRGRWDALITEAITGPPGLFNPNGYVVTAFQAALSAIVNTPVPSEQPADHLREALVAAIRIKDDTDTVAAIAGALLGARWGTGAIPEEWLNLVHGDRRRGSTQITAGDLEELARGALQPGE
jgi:ADP-ribosylglycohydrolase